MSQPPGFEEKLDNQTFVNLTSLSVGSNSHHVPGLIDSQKLSTNLDTIRRKLTLQKRKITIQIVYVDDIIITRDDNQEMEDVKQIMAREFEVKDLGALKYFLGVEIARNKDGISFSKGSTL